MQYTFIKHVEKVSLTKIPYAPEAGLPLIGFDIETYSPRGFPAHKQDPIVTATLAVAPSVKLGKGLIVVSMMFPPAMEGTLLNLLHNLLSTYRGSSLVTYNGKRFDLTYITHRSLLHGLDFEGILASISHIDIYEIVRSALPMLPSHGQKIVEHSLGIRRLVRDVCGANYHQAFNSFLLTGNLTPLFYNIEDSIGCLRMLYALAPKVFSDGEK